MLLDPENMGIAVGISLLSRIQAEINVISYLLPVLSRHFGYLVGATLVPTSPSCSHIIYRKSHQSVPVYSKRLRNGSNWRFAKWQKWRFADSAFRRQVIRRRSVSPKGDSPTCYFSRVFGVVTRSSFDCIPFIH